MEPDLEATVVGGGLAGCEAAWTLANHGIQVRLFDMKPRMRSAAHHMDELCELVCSNSLKSDDVHTASGLLKAEMRLLDSLVLREAEHCRVSAGSALAVDRVLLAKRVTQALSEHPGIRIERREMREVPGDTPVIIAAGPLASDALSASIGTMLGQEHLYFYDAAAPIVSAESIDMDIAFFASRYGKGGADYINCPMDAQSYRAFHRALCEAEAAPGHSFEDARVFEGCMPVEVMARRGERTLAFGPMRPVGITDPRTGRRPYAVLQLRREDGPGGMYNMVGCQTHLRFAEQERVFRMIPGLEHAEFLRYGVMHRNTYIHAPGVLNTRFQWVKDPNVFFAGQLTGVEGYMESACSGILSALHLAAYLKGKPYLSFSDSTMCGALSNYVSNYAGADYQPMNANFGLLPALDAPIRNKRERYAALSRRALREMQAYADAARVI